ncbi:MAG: hypothetical protein NZ851_02650 [Aquificaceae bacterium]|nr:hypothetical protein [Aquificaceae bacterium]
MISGYLNSQQDLVDLLNGCLFNKVGVLDLFLGAETVSLYVERGLIRGFKLGVEEKQKGKNVKSQLLYHLSEFMESPEAFFTFREGENEPMLELEDPIPVEELVLQLQLVHREIKSIMDRVITPMAIVKVLKSFEKSDFYEGKNVYQILVYNQGSLVEEVRKLKSLFAEGYLDINQFYGPDFPSEETRIEYMMKNVETTKVNLITLLENFQLSKFNGFVEIRRGDFEFNLYYKKGKLFAVYPYNSEIFDFLLNPRDKSYMNVVSVGSGILDLLVLKHSEDKTICGLPANFFEVGKALMGMVLERRTGMLTFYHEDRKNHILYRDGTFVGVVREEDGEIKVVKKVPYNKSGLVDMVFYQPMENIGYVVHQFLINLIYGILLRHAGHLNQLILTQLSFSDVLKYQDGTILYRKKPTDSEEIFGFLHFLLDLSYNMLGRGKLERELETVMEPYRDIVKILRVEEYIKLPEQ